MLTASQHVWRMLIASQHVWRMLPASQHVWRVLNASQHVWRMLIASSLVGTEQPVIAKSSLILDVKPVSVAWYGRIIVPLCVILIPPLFRV